MPSFRAPATTLLSLAAGAIAAAAVGAAWVPLTREAALREQATLSDELSVIAELGRVQLRPTVLGGMDPGALTTQLETLRSASRVDLIALIDASGEVIAAADSAAPTPLGLIATCRSTLDDQGGPEVARTGATVDGPRLLQAACVRLQPEQAETATLVVVATGDYGEALSASRTRATLLFLGLGVVVGLVVVGATRWLLSPVQAVSKAAARIAQGERGVKVVVRGPEEIAQLGRAVNTLAAEVEAREDEIQARLDVVNQLSSMVAHEVRNPLQSLSLLSSLARTEPDPETRASLLMKVESEIHVLEGVVQRFLRSSGPLQIARGTADLVEVLSVAAEVARPEADKRDVALLLQAPGRLEGEFDSSLVRRALENLILNAIEFAGQEPPGQVAVAIRPKGGGALIIVEDDGPGVPPAQRARIFQAYYSSKAGGTGLGLALVKQVFDAHGGTISCEESPLGGARFVATLPLPRSPRGALR